MVKILLFATCIGVMKMTLIIIKVYTSFILINHCALLGKKIVDTRGTLI